MATKKETTAIEKSAPAGALVIPDYGDDAGKGYENQSKADTSIPFINLLQGLSPMVKDGKARAGDFYNTVTQQVWPRETGLKFVAGTTKRMYGKWIPRTQGGGFRGHLQVDDPIVLKALKDATKLGKLRIQEKDEDKVIDIDLVETFYIYGCILNEEDEADSMCVIPFASSKIRPYRSWNSRLLTFNQQHGGKIPLYGNLTKMTSFEDKKPKGEFYVPILASADPRGLRESLVGPDHSAFQMAKACAQLVNSGDANINYEKSREADDDDDSPGGSGQKTPF